MAAIEGVSPSAATGAAATDISPPSEERSIVAPSDAALNNVESADARSAHMDAARLDPAGMGASKPRAIHATEAIAADGRRGEVLAMLRAASKPLSIAEIAMRLAIHRNTARFHLDTLVESGRAERVPSASGRPGRPPFVFRATAGMDPAGPRNYRLLAEILVRSLAAEPHPQAKATAAGRVWGRQTKARARPADTPPHAEPHAAAKSHAATPEADTKSRAAEPRAAAEPGADGTSWTDGGHHARGPGITSASRWRRQGDSAPASTSGPAAHSAPSPHSAPASDGAHVPGDRRAQSLTASEATLRLEGLLADFGFEPESGGDRPATHVILRHCPFLDLAETGDRIACAVHLGLMQGALAAMDAPITVTRLDPFVEPDRCVAHLEPAAG